MILPLVWAKADSIGIALTLILILTLIVLPAFGLAKLSVFLGTKWRSRGQDPTRLPERAKPPARIRWGIVLALIVVFLYFTPADSRIRWPFHPPDPNSIPVWIPILVVVGPVAGYVLFLGSRYYDPLLTRAIRQGRSGDLDAAIAILQAGIEVRPTANRANQLAVYQMAEEDWAEAYKSLLLAKELGLGEDLYRINASAALLNLGRPADALSVLVPHVHTSKPNLVEFCNYCLTLLALDRTAEALEVIRHAETLYRTTPTASAEQSRQLRTLIDNCRSRYEERAGKAKFTDRDEL